MNKIAFLVLISAVFSLVSCKNEDGLVSRSELEPVLRANYLCYAMDSMETCGWAETYYNFGSDTVYTQSATGMDFGLSIVSQKLTWKGNMLCHDNETPYLNVYETYIADYDFKFDLSNASSISETEADEVRTIMERETPNNMCFGYVKSESGGKRYSQITYIDGVKQPKQDAVAAFSLSNKQVTIRPSY